jgi:asparagine N-glycosylation enzyme membrane subunit Stt3
MALGPVGFFVFLVYFGSILVLASHDLRRHTDPYWKAVSYFVLASFISALVVGMVDQYWNGQRGAVFLGALAGILSVLHCRLEADEGRLMSSTQRCGDEEFGSSRAKP